MKSPKDMRIIQIDITNACVHQCSNCTRFCGHHKKPFFMDYETFKMAVDSLEGFEGCVGVMGGEPTLHPEFNHFVEYIGEKHPSAHKLYSNMKPITNFGRYIHDKNYILDEMLNKRKGPGLWSSVCDSYYRNFELIQDTFSFQNINDHNNKSLHLPILVSRKEMGIDDESWIDIRNNCSIQSQWSATITPKGAFFCEIAAALDMLFDGPGGWKIEPGWWKRDPKDFGEQLKWCEICGGAFMKKGRLSNEEMDDVSPMLYEMLEKVESPKLKRGRVLVMDMERQGELQPMPDTVNRYLTEHDERVSKNNRKIYPRKINPIHIKDASFGEIVSCELFKSDNDWIVCSEEKIPDEELCNRLSNVVLNPGVLYMYDGCYIFNVAASALRGKFAVVREFNCKEDMVTLWKKDKIVELDDYFDSDNKNPDIDEWYSYVDALEQSDKKDLYKCLDKIKSDYE